MWISDGYDTVFLHICNDNACFCCRMTDYRCMYRWSHHDMSMFLRLCATERYRSFIVLSHNIMIMTLCAGIASNVVISPHRPMEARHSFRRPMLCWDAGP